MAIPARRERLAHPAAVGPRTEDAQQPRPGHPPRVGDHLLVRLQGRLPPAKGNPGRPTTRPPHPAHGTRPAPALSMRASSPSTGWSRPCTHCSHLGGRDDGRGVTGWDCATTSGARRPLPGPGSRSGTSVGSVHGVLSHPHSARGTDHSPPVPRALSEERVRDLSVPAGAYDRTLENRARQWW